jgi:pyruvate kinase
VFTQNLETVRRVCLSRGTCFRLFLFLFFILIDGILLNDIPPAEEIFGEMELQLKRIGAVKTGDVVVYTAGLPALEHASTNTVHVKPVE